MHTLLIAVSLVLAGFGGILCLRLLRGIGSWDNRRPVQMAGLFLPVLVLGLLALVLLHLFPQMCFQGAPPADVAVTQVLALAGALAILAAFTLNILRALLIPVQLRRRTWGAPGWLKHLVLDLSVDLSLKRAPQVRVAADTRPWALVAGPLRPHLVVSSGLLLLLDREELRAALCHELLHIKRADLWWTTIATALFDLAWFLPATRRLYRQMLDEQEVACDDHVVGEASRVALASALAQVWRAQIGQVPSPRGALALLSPDREGRLEARMRRLLERPGSRYAAPSHAMMLVAVGMPVLFVLAQLSATAFAMDKMGCSLQQWIITLIP